MPTIKEALKLALDALQKSFPPDGSKYEVELEQKHREAIAAIQELLDRSVADPEPIGYMQKVIEALYENGDPVSIDAAELLERVSTVTTQWQLIETAPHGKVILGFIPHSMGGYVCPTLRIELGSWNNASCAAFSEVNPTHWMPLPKPPIAAAVNAFNGVKP